MKNLALFLFGMCLSFSSQAQTYKTPKFEYDEAKDQQVKVVSPTSGSWRSNYKVQQVPEVQRGVASDQGVWLDESEKVKKDFSRDPSSESAPTEERFVKPWSWTQK